MFHVVIPARYAASRLPGKPLLTIASRPVIQWVWDRALASGAASVVVATDDDRIRGAAVAFGAECVMTDPQHAELISIIGMASETNALANALQIPVDPQFEVS